jgi:hypothetical protein
LQADWKNPKSDWYIKLNVPVKFQPLSEETVAVRAEREMRKLAERDAEIAANAEEARHIADRLRDDALEKQVVSQ